MLPASGSSRPLCFDLCRMVPASAIVCSGSRSVGRWKSQIPRRELEATLANWTSHPGKEARMAARIHNSRSDPDLTRSSWHDAGDSRLKNKGLQKGRFRLQLRPIAQTPFGHGYLQLQHTSKTGSCEATHRYSTLPTRGAPADRRLAPEVPGGIG